MDQDFTDLGVEARRIACYASASTTTSSEILVGLGGFEPPTSPLSGVRSNQLSYRPRVLINNQQQTIRVGTTQSKESDMGLMSPTRWG